MNKKLALLLAGGAAALLGGCGKKDAIEDYSKYVELGPYTGLSVDRLVSTVTDEDLQEEIQAQLSYGADYSEITDRAAQNGDVVTISYVGTIDGEEFEGGSEEDAEVELGSELYIDGFEDAIVGMKTGEEKTFELTFPEPYDGELDGQTAEFTVTLNSIYEVVYPQYDDEFVASISDYDNVADYEAGLRQELESEYEEESLNMAREDALMQVIDASTFNGRPDDLYEQCKASLDADNQALMEAFGLDDISELYGGDYDPEDLITDNVNEHMVVSMIAKAEELSVSDEECTASIEEALPDSDYTTVEEFQENTDMDAYKYDLLRDKVLLFLQENNTFQEVSEDEYYADEEDLGDVEILDEDADAEAPDEDADAEAPDEDAEADETETSENETADTEAQ